MNALEILVVILSLFLAVFLLVGIILTTMLVRVTQQIKRVTATAERTAVGIEHVVTKAGKVATPAAIGRVVFDQIKKSRKKG